MGLLFSNFPMTVYTVLFHTFICFATGRFRLKTICCKSCCFRSRICLYGIKYGFVAMLFSTPYIAFSILFSFTYIFVIRREKQIGATRLAPYLLPESRNELYLVVGEFHHPKCPQPAASPRWLIVPERGLFTGIAVFGAGDFLHPRRFPLRETRWSPLAGFAAGRRPHASSPALRSRLPSGRRWLFRDGCGWPSGSTVAAIQNGPPCLVAHLFRQCI